jgi:sugar/nucleoside kinase (ribokinase family)
MIVMKLLIIGHSVVDRINFKGKLKLQPGGIHYSIAALSSFAAEDDEIYLCSSLSEKVWSLFDHFYSKVNIKYITTVKENDERDEKYNRIIDPLILPDCDLNIFDGILVNMISGYDITLLQMMEIRKKFKGEIFFDVHTLSRGLDNNGKRTFRRIKNFKEWAMNIDILQANEQEILTLTDKHGEIEIIKDMFMYGVKAVIITKGKAGLIAYLKNQSATNPVKISSIKVNTVNKVGCGDIFGAVFFYNYIRCRDIVKSLEIANIAVGISATNSEITDFNNLKKDVFQRYS